MFLLKHSMIKSCKDLVAHLSVKNIKNSKNIIQKFGEMIIRFQGNRTAYIAKKYS